MSRCALGIEAVRALMPLLEQRTRSRCSPIRDALSQLQMAYAREAGGGARRPPAAQPRAAGSPRAGRSLPRRPSNGAAGRADSGFRPEAPPR